MNPRIKECQERAEPSDTPLNVMLETSAVCNLECPMCPRQHKARRQRQDGLMAYRAMADPLDESDTFHRVMSQIHPLRLGMFYSGEPLLNRHFCTMANEAKYIYNMPDMRVNTNGTTLVRDSDIEALLRSGVDEVIFSLECNERAQKMLRVGADYGRVKTNILRCLELKKILKLNRPSLTIQHLSGEGITVEDLTASKIEWAGRGIHVKTASISRLAGQVPDLGDTRKDKPRCREIWTNAIISWRGDVTCCCVDHGFALSLGNMLQVPLDQLWRGKRITALRKGHTVYNQTGNTSRLPALCRNCLGVGK